MIDIDKLSISELVAHGVRAEIDSNRFYSSLAGSIENFVVKDKLNYIAGEESKHEKMLRGLYKTMFGDEKITIPEKSIVPGPKFEVKDEQPLSEWLKLAMEAEERTSDFYRKMAEKFSEEDVKYLLNYLASVEMGHYTLLKGELDMSLRFDDYDRIVPMVHLGA